MHSLLLPLCLIGVWRQDPEAAAPAPPLPAPREARLVDGRTGEPASWDALVRQMARKDVVFLGEEHDSLAFHAIQAALLRELHDARGDVVLSLEMFERDVQGVLDDYLRGRVSEEEFRERARPWKHYDERYRPLVELARERGLDVLAANVPRRLASALAAPDAPFRVHPDGPRSTSAPRDLYWRLFHGAMVGHMGADGGDAIFGMYRAQCLKDDAMAEAITDYLRAHGHRRPLVVHLNGQFHSDYGFGTTARVVQRDPAASIGLVTMVSVDDPDTAEVEPFLGRAHFLFLLPTPASRAEQEGADDGNEESAGGSQP